jgi:hypothetical protein
MRQIVFPFFFMRRKSPSGPLIAVAVPLSWKDTGNTNSPRLQSALGFRVRTVRSETECRGIQVPPKFGGAFSQIKSGALSTAGEPIKHFPVEIGMDNNPMFGVWNHGDGVG